MNTIIGKFIATCLWFITGIVFAPDLRAQPSENLNQIENYNSSTCQIVFNGSYTCSGVLINNTQDQGRPLVHRLIQSVHKDMKSANVFKLLESVRVNHSSVSVH